MLQAIKWAVKFWAKIDRKIFLQGKKLGDVGDKNSG